MAGNKQRYHVGFEEAAPKINTDPDGNRYFCDRSNIIASLKIQTQHKHKPHKGDQIQSPRIGMQY